MEIRGKIHTAICFTDYIEESAVSQIITMCNYDLGEHIRIMSDVHAGKGCTIGTTMKIKDKCTPNLVGVDIGCGMYTLNLGKINIDLGKMDEICHQIPSGFNVWNQSIETFDLSGLRCFSALEKKERIEKSLGTLGGGNHFIEIDEAGDGTKYLIIHTGSRNLGKQVCDYYQKIAINYCRKVSKERIDALTEELKKQGREKEIKKERQQLRPLYPNVPKDLCFLMNDDLEDYLHDIEIVQNFAKRNRELISLKILDYLDIKVIDSFHTIHNYIDTDEMILRKGAISAKKGELILIPINMRDGSILGRGLGNEEWNYSAPHGAGRIMSRSQARENVSLEAFKASMEGVYTTSVNESTIDESAFVYKSIDQILPYIKESVDVIDVLKPIYNFKA